MQKLNSSFFADLVNLLAKLEKETNAKVEIHPLNGGLQFIFRYQFKKDTYAYNFNLPFEEVIAYRPDYLDDLIKKNIEEANRKFLKACNDKMREGD